MSETVALSKFACPACGGEANWNPGKQKLVCPFCGTESPAKLDATGAIVRSTTSCRRCAGSATTGAAGRRSLRQVKCRSCQAISVLDPKRQAQNCEFCGSAQLVAYEEAKPAFRPESVLPFKVSEPQARDRIRAWYGRLWLAPGALKRKALTDTVRGVYLPYWTFDARVDADVDGRGGPLRTTRPRLTRRTGRRARGRCGRCAGSPPPGACSTSSTTTSSARRWASILRCCAASSRSRPASSDPTTPGYVAGWVVERYQIDLVAAAQRAREAMDRKVEALCAREVPGDTLPQPQRAHRLRRPDVQAHPGAGVAAVVQLRRRRPTSA